MMTHSQTCRDLVASFEGLRLESYPDVGGVWTIGYGHTGTQVVRGMRCTQYDALNWLDLDLRTAEKSVNSALAVKVNQNEFDALVSLAYNIGGSALLHSTLIRLLNAHDVQGAANQFLAWDKVNGKPVAGLTKRRMYERELFLKEPAQ